MSWPIETIPFLLSSALMSVLGVYSLRRTNVIGARGFAYVMFSSAIWTFAYAMDLASRTVEAKTVWLQLKYLGVAPSTLLWLAFTLELTGHSAVLKTAWFRSLWVFPAVLLAVVFTNPVHQEFWTSIEVLPGEIDSIIGHGSAFAFYVVANHVLAAASLILLLRHTWISSPFFRRRNGWLIAGLFCPFVGQAIEMGWLPSIITTVDHVPLMYTPAAIFLSVAIFRFQAMDILPLALRLVFQNIKAAVIVVDQRLEVVSMNDHAKERWQWEPSAGSLLGSVVPELADRELVDGEELEISSTARGEDYLVMISVVGSPSEGDLGRALMFVDITDRKAAERASRAAVAAKTAFLASVSHELRTPLHGISGLTQMLLDTDVDEKQLDYLRRSQASSQLLASLIDDLLDQANLELGQMHFEQVPFDLHSIVSQVESSQSISAKNANIQFSVASVKFGCAIVGDPLRLTQVLMNLVANAIKFTDTGGVFLDVRVSGESGNQLTVFFRVTDTGIGIRADQIDLLFEPFRQADSSITRRYGGTGLGLAISQSLVRDMGGEIVVESNIGQGTTFSFELKFPTPDEPALPIPTHSQAPPDLAGRTLLVVDDTPLNLEVIEAMIVRTGAQLQMVQTRSDAIEAAMHTVFDLVLMDLYMPESDGFGTAMALRRVNGYASVPIVAMSASVLEEDREKAFRAGMVGFIGKPFTRREIYDVLDHHLVSGGGTSPTLGRTLASTEKPRPQFGVDADEAIRNLQCDRERFRGFLVALIEEAEKQMHAIRSATTPLEIQEYAHSLIGMAGMVGAVGVSETARQLEVSARLAEPITLQAVRIEALAAAIEGVRLFLAGGGGD